MHACMHAYIHTYMCLWLLLTPPIFLIWLLMTATWHEVMSHSVSSWFKFWEESGSTGEVSGEMIVRNLEDLEDWKKTW